MHLGAGRGERRSLKKTRPLDPYCRMGAATEGRGLRIFSENAPRLSLGDS